MKLRPPNPDTLRSLRILEKDVNYDNVITWLADEAERLAKAAIASNGDMQQRLCGAFDMLNEILEYSNRADSILMARQKPR